MPMPSPEFTHRNPHAFGTPVHRLGLAGTHGIDETGTAAALERGPNYIFWSATQRKLTAALRPVLAKNREKYVVAAGPTIGYFGGSVRRGAERALRALGTDYLDVFQ